jgi:hypothetical protein
MAARYGKKRWVRQEGPNGLLAKRYKLNTGKRQFRSRRRVDWRRTSSSPSCWRLPSTPASRPPRTTPTAVAV